MSLAAALDAGHPDVQAVYQSLVPDDRAGAASLALSYGRPTLAAAWAADPRHTDALTLAAALLRLGRAAEALDALEAQPDTARTALLRARARWQLGQRADQADVARILARREGDTPALMAAVTLAGEQALGAPYAALRVLAEGLKVAELTGRPADAHLLAVLAHAQLRSGGAKGRRTAERALERSVARSPARVLALFALSRDAEALRDARDGELHPVWWEVVRVGRPTAAALAPSTPADDR
ncbi:hypothetical protein HNQ07_000307 [Deinococcus metalli]|uniref:Tetratricopeptide repeat protein n=1 Tax=Deinococcus metalli TaxID=1141878 RepID=A0A7W8KBU1_9DEIO|nr:hypothetical protein [Deinococcus metalli]MBB5374863.1 hypothetical protein [Deinococcus metalli]GHF33133.1 hypothetical protein GCM10017781_07350 [Deinococcus metalli]